MTTAEDILIKFRIAPTKNRIGLLKLILEAENRPFSIQDIKNQIPVVDADLSITTIDNTLQLFVARKILIAFPAPKTEKKKGRPCMLYVIDPVLNYATNPAQSD